MNIEAFKVDMYEKTKYAVGDVFIRNYNGVMLLCILISRDFDQTWNRAVWQSTAMLLHNDGVGGGEVSQYIEDDLDSFDFVGKISAKKLPDGKAKIEFIANDTA